jgi:hypothetical protein
VICYRNIGLILGNNTSALSAFLYKLIETATAGLRSSSTGVQAAPVRHYLRAASDCFRVILDLSVPDCHLASGRIMSDFENAIGRVRGWQKLHARREPYSQEMLSAQARGVVELHTDASRSFFDLVAAVFDWVRLGIFTGSRGIEYCSTVTIKRC